MGPMMGQFVGEEVYQSAEQGGVRTRSRQTGIPAHMQQYVERKTGVSYEDVRVHYNSSKPAQFEALGYTQGSEVFLAKGQEKHLMHELCHVAQQKKGRVVPTASIGTYTINDDIGLEKEAESYEKQYEREKPVQMLKDAVSKPSHIMEQKGLPGSSLRYRTIGEATLTVGNRMIKGGIWSYKAPWMPSGQGDHAEEAICDLVQHLSILGYDMKGERLTIKLSASPCARCQARLNELVTTYGLEVKVEAAHRYTGTKGGGPGSDEDRQYELEICAREDKKRLLQL